MASFEEILRDVESFAPSEFKELERDRQLLEEIKDIIRRVADEAVKEGREAESRKTDADFVSSLPPEVVKKISYALKAETIDMNISKIDGVYTAEVMRNGKRVFPALQLKTEDDVGAMSNIQMASVYIELVLLLGSCAGIDVHVSEAQIKSMAEKVVKMISEPGMEKALQNFLKTWKAPGVSEKAKAIWALLKASYSFGILKKTFMLIIANMNWIERIKAVAKFVAYIVAAISTGGAAVMAKFVLALKTYGVKLGKKMLNLDHLTEIKNGMAEKAE